MPKSSIESWNPFMRSRVRISSVHAIHLGHQQVQGDVGGLPFLDGTEEVGHAIQGPRLEAGRFGDELHQSPDLGVVIQNEQLSACQT